MHSFSAPDCLSESFFSVIPILFPEAPVPFSPAQCRALCYSLKMCVEAQQVHKCSQHSRNHQVQGRQTGQHQRCALYPALQRHCRAQPQLQHTRPGCQGSPGVATLSLPTASRREHNTSNVRDPFAPVQLLISLHTLHSRWHSLARAVDIFNAFSSIYNFSIM